MVPKMKLWMRAATVASVFWLLGWYFVYGQDMLVDMQNALVEARKPPAKEPDPAELAKAWRKACDNYHSKPKPERAQNRREFDPLEKFDPDKWICENKVGAPGTYKPAPPPPKKPTEAELIWNIAQDYLWPQVGFLSAIWIFFAMLQWLIRGSF
jgi:hypothetical protein